MATYVMSDIHGEYEKYKNALKTINLRNDDVLYVLGDVVDRGSGSCKILLDMMCRFNVIPLLGNHEYMAITVLKKLMQEITESSMADFHQDFMTGMIDWFDNGGKPTLDEFKSLPRDDQWAILEYLEEFSLYQEITVNGQSYILVHAGLGNFDPARSLRSYSLYELIWGRADYNKVYFPNKILITGHTPVMSISGQNTPKILKQNNHIAIDCGSGFGGKLAVLCLDTMEEFYF